jgi:7-cyano-7-deazaguanine synthase
MALDQQNTLTLDPPKEAEREPQDKAVVLLSGGMDSATLLYKAVVDGFTCHAVAFDYGQKHARELEYAQRIAAHRAETFHVVPLTEVSAQFLRTANSSQTNPAIPVPHGHYADENMKVTVVPNRNMMMLSVAAAYAISIGADTVAYAAHAGDHAIYPDCRPAFISAMSTALEHCHFEPGIALYAPFSEITKTDIVKIGWLLGVPYEETWSCYEGRTLHCGKCGTCVERREAFLLAGVDDPTVWSRGS